MGRTRSVFGIRGRALALGLTGAIAAGLMLPAAGQAAVTIGSNLVNPPTTNVGGPITNANSVLPAASRAPGGVASPVNGIVTAWRVRRAGGSNLTVALRVIRPLGSSGLFDGAGTSQAVMPPAASTTTSSTALPISIGDLIGVDTPTGAIGILRTTPGAERLSWHTPALANGGGGRAPTSVTSTITNEVTVNADVEPTSAFTVEGIKKLKKGRLRVTLSLPNPGLLVAGDIRDPQTAATAAKKKKKKKKKRKKKRRLQRISIAVGGPGQVVLMLKPTKAARKALKRKVRRLGKKRPKLKAKLRVSYTPMGGSTSVQTRKTKIKR